MTSVSSVVLESESVALTYLALQDAVDQTASVAPASISVALVVRRVSVLPVSSVEQLEWKASTLAAPRVVAVPITCVELALISVALAVKKPLVMTAPNADSLEKVESQFNVPLDAAEPTISVVSVLTSAVSVAKMTLVLLVWSAALVLA